MPVPAENRAAYVSGVLTMLATLAERTPGNEAVAEVLRRSADQPDTAMAMIGQVLAPLGWDNLIGRMTRIANLFRDLAAATVAGKSTDVIIVELNAAMAALPLGELTAAFYNAMSIEGGQ